MSIYTAPTLTGYNTSPPADDGTQVSSNQVLWSTIKTKLADPLRTFADNINTAIEAAVDTLTSFSRNQNLLINGGFRIAQRGASFTSATTPANNDDTYLLDRWVLLSDGNDIVDVSQEAAVVPTGAYAAIKLDVETANAKFGILQILEARDAKAIIGGTCSLSFKARITGSTIGRIRAGVLAWSSTADSVTSDVVSAWGGAGTNPTLVANWTFENTPADLTAPTTSYQTYTIENISVDTASATNVAVFIWTDDVTMSVGDFLYIADVQLESGSVATSFDRPLMADELSRCQRFYERHGDGTNNWPILQMDAAGANVLRQSVPFNTTKRIAPTMTKAGTWAVTNCGQPVVDTFSTHGYGLGVTASGAGNTLTFPNGADDYIEASAEL